MKMFCRSLPVKRIGGTFLSRILQATRGWKTPPILFATTFILFAFCASAHAAYPESKQIQLGGSVWPWVAFSKEPLWMQLRSAPSGMYRLEIRFRPFSRFSSSWSEKASQELTLTSLSRFVQTKLPAPSAKGLYWIDYTLVRGTETVAEGSHRLAVIARPATDSSFGTCVLSSFSAEGGPASGGRDRRPGDHPELGRLLGTLWNRPIISWRSVEPKQGEFRWDEVDRLVQERTQGGLHLAPLVACTPKWAGKKENGPPSDWSGWQNFVRLLVNRYKNRVRVWGFGNEINLSDRYPDWTPPVVVQYLKTSYEAAKQADPECTVLFPGTAFVDLAFIESVYRAGGKPFFNAMNLHPYAFPLSPESGQASLLNPMANFSRLLDLRALMQRCGDGAKPIWITELSWNDGVGAIPRLPDGQDELPLRPPVKVKKPFDRLINTELDQARYLVRAAVLAQSWSVEKVFLLSLVDLFDEVKSPFSRPGLFTKNLQPKLSCVAWASLTSCLNGARFVKVLETTHPDQHVLQFRKGRRTVWVAWDEKKASIVQLPVGPGRVKTVDFWGNPALFKNTKLQLFFRLGPNPRYCIARSA